MLWDVAGAFAFSVSPPECSATPEQVVELFGYAPRPASVPRRPFPSGPHRAAVADREPLPHTS